MFPDKFKVYAVVSIPGMPGMDSLDTFLPKIEGYYPYIEDAQAEATRLSTWKGTAVVEQEFSSSDLIRILNRVLEEQTNG